MNEENILNKSQNDTNNTNSQEGVPNVTGDKKAIRDEKGRFIPGVVNNPEGRPKGSISIVTYLKKVLEEEMDVVDPATGNKGKQTKAEIIARNIIAGASKNDKIMAKLLISYVDGLPTQNIKMEGNIKTSNLTEEEKQKIINELKGV